MSRRRKQPKLRVLTEAQLDALLAKLRTPDAALDGPDRGNLAGIVESFAHVIELVVSGRTSELYRLLGITRSRTAESGAAQASEAADEGPRPSDPAPGEAGAPAAVSTDDAGPQEAEEKRRDEHGRRGPEAFKKLVHEHHAHRQLAVGDVCPECARGRLYKHAPDEFTIVTGQSPLVATRHTVECLRCSLCKSVFKAPLPEPLLADGVEIRPLYSYSAVAMVVFYRFFAGLPMHRQDKLQRALGVPVPDASIWDMCERFADVARLVVRELHRLAADAILFFGDDTGAKILDTRWKVKPRRKDGELELRTGCHTTCVIAVTPDNRAITLFATGIHHTGEVMDLVVGQRTPGLSPPVFMGDCISSNTVTKSVVLYAGCNAHAVRKFKELADRYPEHSGYALERYEKIFKIEADCRAQGLCPEARRDRHKRESLPLLHEICEHGHELLEGHKIEPNSDIAGAYKYIIENLRRLSAFAREPHAPLDNNRCERELKIIIQLRDTARYFRNTVGAGVADCTLTLGATGLAAGANLPDYFTALQRNAADVRAHPDRWLPWCYQAREGELEDHRSAN